MVCPDRTSLRSRRDFSGELRDELRESCPMAAKSFPLASHGFPGTRPRAALKAVPWLRSGPRRGHSSLAVGGAIPVIRMASVPTNIKPPSAGVVCANVRCNGSAAPVIHLMGGAARHTRAQLCEIVRHWPCRSLARLTSAALFWIRLWHRLRHLPPSGALA